MLRRDAPYRPRALLAVRSWRLLHRGIATLRYEVKVMRMTSRLLAAVPAWPVSDERRAVRFFAALLGFTELRQGERGLGIVRRDSVEIHLWVPDGRSPGAERYLAGSAACRIEVTGLEDLYDACSRSGVVHPNAPLAATSWDTREFGVLDPDNNLITFFERVQTPPRVTPGLGWPATGPDAHAG